MRNELGLVPRPTRRRMNGLTLACHRVALRALAASRAPGSPAALESSCGGFCRRGAGGAALGARRRLRTRRGSAGRLVLAVVLAPSLIDASFKPLVARAARSRRRAQRAPERPTGYSFPSGHAARRRGGSPGAGAHVAAAAPWRLGVGALRGRLA